MKRFLIPLFTILLSTLTLEAQTSPTTTVGYVFTANLQAHKSKSPKSKVTSTIRKGHVAVVRENNELWFSCPDVAEFIKRGSGAFYKYFPPAQDDVPAEYISVKAFNKAVRKVNISSQMPKSWVAGKIYTFKRSSPAESELLVTVRAIPLKGNVSLVTNVNYENDFSPTSTIDITGQSIIELKINNLETIYIFNGEQVFLASNLAGGTYDTLVVDDNGVTYAKDENGALRPDARLSYVFGEIPEISFFGWISDTEVVVDDMLYVLDK